jgi:hypothetical protein
VILLDTSGLLSAIHASQRHHAACAAALIEATPPLEPYRNTDIDLSVILPQDRGKRPVGGSWYPLG